MAGKMQEAVVMRDSSGKVSAKEIHDQMTAGVDDSRIVKRTKKRLVDEGFFTKEESEVLFGK